MRGAVLHKIGLDFVTDRIARRSYGVTFNAEYRPGYHPPARKVTCIDGVVRCENVMQWYAKRVCLGVYRMKLIAGGETLGWS